LQDHGADVNHEVKDGNTALMAAVREDRREVRSSVVPFNVECTCITCIIQDEHPVQRHTHRIPSQAVKLLLRKGARPDRVSERSGISAVSLAQDKVRWSWIQQVCSCTPVMTSCQSYLALSNFAGANANADLMPFPCCLFSLADASRGVQPADAVQCDQRC
jgi:ankyrin repeat protein